MHNSCIEPEYFGVDVELLYVKLMSAVTFNTGFVDYTCILDDGSMFERCPPTQNNDAMRT